MARRVKNIFLTTILKPAPTGLIAQDKDPSIPIVLDECDLELSTSYINLNEFKRLLYVSRGKLDVSHYEESLRLSRKYFIQEERQLTINLIQLLQGKMSSFYKDIVFTDQPIVPSVLPLSEFSTSQPDIYVYNTVKLNNGFKIKAASIKSVVDKRSVHGLAVECKRRGKHIKVLDQALGSMVRLGIDLEPYWREENKLIHSKCMAFVLTSCKGLAGF